MKPIILVLAVLMAPGGDRHKKAYDTNLQCGLYCLYVGMFALEMDPKLDDLESRLGPPQAGGYSLADLKRVAEANGLKAMAVHTTAENLAQRNERFACIAHVRGHHFVVVTKVDLKKGLITCIDPPRSSQSFPLAVFNSQWAGDALLISKQDLESEESFAARAPWLDLSLPKLVGWGVVLLAVSLLFAITKLLRRGKVQAAARGILVLLLLSGCTSHAESEPVPPSLLILSPQVDYGELTVSPNGHAAFFEVQNRGEEILLIEEIHSSCGCAVVKPATREVAPGELRKIEVNLRAAQPEDHESRVTFKTNDPMFPIQSVELHWRVRAPVEFDPPRLEIGRVRPGAEVRRTVKLVRRTMTGAQTGELTRLTASPREQITADDLRPAQNGHGDLVDILLQVGDDAGSFHGMITARLEGGTQSSLHLPVTWTVRPQYVPIPERVFLGISSPGAGLNGEFHLSTDLDSGLHISRCSGLKSFPGSKIDAESIDATHAAVKFTLSAPESEGVYRDEITLQIEGGETVVVPVSGIVQASATAATAE